MFNGLGMNISNLSRLSDARSRSVSPENFTGEPGKGGMATEGTGKNCAREMGRGWKISPSVSIAPGETITLADISGQGAVQSIWMTGQLSLESILRIYWDGSDTPSVEVPLPAFFALFTNKAENNNGLFPLLTSSAVMVAPCRGMSCYWEMPFRSSFRFTLENRSAHNQVCYYQINYTLTEVPDDCAYFHAQYRQSCPVPYMGVHTVLDGIKGKGQFVGCAMYAGLNSAGGWWGEGEFKFYIDSDTEYPTICGTGTEDYFLGAYNWDNGGKYETYSGPYAGMFQVIPSNGLYASQMRFSMYRWHIPDPIRFESGIKVTVQDLGWRSDGRYLSRRDDIRTVAYWYQSAPASDFPTLPSVEELEIN